MNNSNSVLTAGSIMSLIRRYTDQHMSLRMFKHPFDLSSHIARHTHRQLLAKAGSEDIGVIKCMMGHNGRGDVIRRKLVVKDGRELLLSIPRGYN